MAPTFQSRLSVFALAATELVEGSVRNGRIEERRWPNLTAPLR